MDKIEKSKEELAEDLHNLEQEVKSLKVIEENYKYIFDDSIVGKSITNVDGSLNVNQAFCDILGYSSDELKLLKWQEITHPDDVERDQSVINSIITDEYKSKRWEKRYIHKNGQIVWVDISIFLKRDSEEKPLFFITTIQDITERKQAEVKERLAYENERRFKDSNIVGVVVATADGKIVEANDYYLNLLGITREEYKSGQVDWRKITPPEWLAADEQAISEIREKGFCKPYEKEYFHKNGSRVTVLLSDALIPGPEVQIIAFCLDITERKQAEEDLKLSENRYRNIFESAVIGIYRTTPDGEILMANPTLVKILGFSSFEELAKRKLEDEGFGTNSLREDFRKGIEKNGSLTAYESVWKTADGKSVYISENSKAFYNSSGEVIYYEGTIEDITERKNVEEALKASEDYFRSLFENMLNGYAYCQMIFKEGHPYDFIYLSVNKAFESLTGLINVIGKNVSDVIPQIRESDSELLEIYGRVASTGKPEVFEMYVESLLKWFSVSVYSPKKDFFVAIFDVITERKKAEEEIIKLNANLEQRVIQRTEQLEMANKELEAFTYSVSHDLRAPLRHINGYVDLLLRRFHDTLPDKGQHYLDTIADSANQMGTLIDELLEFSRTGRQELHHLELDMNKVLEEALNQIKCANQRRNIDWKISNLPSVVCDHSMIRLVWINLLSNAVKFTRPQEKAVIEISSYIENNEVVFFVRDNGVGFDMQYSNKLFGVFQRLHPVEDFEGTGIGLANVRRIISKHGGRTWAESVLDKGAIFYFTIPINKE